MPENRYTHVFFDLDGTLLDTGAGVKHAFQHALRSLGLAVPEESALDYVLGPPLFWSFHEKVGLPQPQAEQAVGLFRSYYETTGLWECRVFEGIAPLLKTLAENGVCLAVVTGKPEAYAEKLLQHFGLRELFCAVCGTAPADRDASKQLLLERAFTACGVPQDKHAQVLMVGDRCFDIDGARQTGTHSAGVLYGFGSRQELEAHAPTYLVENAAQLLPLICR